jgi:hypothetical protein
MTTPSAAIYVKLARVSRTRLALVSGVALAQLWSPPSAAIEPRSLTEPDVLREPAAVTHVVDAFDGPGGVDLHFTLEYRHSWKRATILREVPAATSADGKSPLADYSESTSRLDLRAELGLFHDLALIVQLPIILSSRRDLSGRTGAEALLDGAPGEPLFSLPSSSPNRSGVEYLGVGVDWGILNQWRDAAQPTLLVGAEARFAVSEPMHACGPAPGTEAGGSAMRCAQPADIDRNGVGGEYVTLVQPGRSISLEGDFPAGGRRAGVSRGTTALSLRALVSRRFQYLEPYLGFAALFEVANQNSDFRTDGPGSANPPTRGSFSLGSELMPWEVVEQFQRLSFDGRLTATYHSEGQDYSELFDALGSSGAPSFRRPNFASYVANTDPATQAAFPSVVDPDSERVFPTGLTRVQAHGSYAARLRARWQAGRYVHFDLGGALTLTQAHSLTLGEACAPGGPSELARAGPCLVGVAGAQRVLGAPDPAFRPQISQPGRRFSVGTATTLDAWVGATVMF